MSWEKHLHLHHAVKNTAKQNTEEPLYIRRCYTDVQVRGMRLCRGTLQQLETKLIIFQLGTVRALLLAYTPSRISTVEKVLYTRNVCVIRQF